MVSKSTNTEKCSQWRFLRAGLIYRAPFPGKSVAMTCICSFGVCLTTEDSKVRISIFSSAKGDRGHAKERYIRKRAIGVLLSEQARRIGAKRTVVLTLRHYEKPSAGYERPF